jgi:hypothetical protein
MATQYMKISSRSTPPGGAPFDLSLDIFSDLGQHRYDTEETFREALLTLTQATEAGCNYTLGILKENEKGWVIVDARLTDAGRKAFGIE